MTKLHEYPPCLLPLYILCPCTFQVPRVQYGTGGYRQMPRGLVLETFLTHANPYNVADNRIPKVRQRQLEERLPRRPCVDSIPPRSNTPSFQCLHVFLELPTNTRVYSNTYIPGSNHNSRWTTVKTLTPVLSKHVYLHTIFEPGS